MFPKDRNPRTVLVLGGAGFVGRNAVNALLLTGHRVIIGTRHAATRDPRLVGDATRCERREVHVHRLLHAKDWAVTLEGIDAVINCVGVLRPRLGETYERVHHLAPLALAKACSARGLRLVHVSALGLRRDARSRFLSSKKRGERAVLESATDAFVVRPSLLIGDGGFGARWIARVANWPLHPLAASARGRISALRVEELGECLARVALAPAGDAVLTHRCIELGGPSLTTMGDLLHALRTRPHAALRIPIPAIAARTVAHICDALYLTPFSFGHFELLLRDNAPAVNHAPLILGRAPAHVSDERGAIAVPATYAAQVSQGQRL